MKRSVDGKKVVVVGMGKSGVAASLLLKSMGAEVRASDILNDGAVQESCGLLREAGVEYEIGEQGGALLEGIDLLVVSPGVEEGAAIVAAASEKGIEVVSEIELASWFWRGKIIAITGTNGKTTTACMIKAILDTAGRSSVLAGNLGYPFSSAVLHNGDAELVILEVSSFQLEHIYLFHPQVAVLLNLAPDHLDRYGDIREYYDFKLLIFPNQEPGDWAICRWNEREAVQPFISRTGAAEMTFGLDGGRLTISGDDIELDGEKVLSLRGFGLPGSHNRENALAAAAATIAWDVDEGAIEKALLSFKGLAHRLELVGMYRGIAFCNDSKSTNLDAMLKALSSFSSPLILIAGGKDKGEDYYSVREEVATRARAVFLVGESGAAMMDALSGCCEVVSCSSLEEAVAGATARADRGDIVLLSPGCSSLDMYGGFEERGDHFKRVIRNLRGVEDE